MPRVRSHPSDSVTHSPAISLLWCVSSVSILSQAFCWHTTESKAGMVSVLMELFTLINGSPQHKGLHQAQRPEVAGNANKNDKWFGSCNWWNYLVRQRRLQEEQVCRERLEIQFGACLICQVNIQVEVLSKQLVGCMNPSWGGMSRGFKDVSLEVVSM